MSLWSNLGAVIARNYPVMIIWLVIALIGIPFYIVMDLPLWWLFLTMFVGMVVRIGWLEINRVKTL